jgi:hypothetical protein
LLDAWQANVLAFQAIAEQRHNEGHDSLLQKKIRQSGTEP